MAGDMAGAGAGDGDGDEPELEKGNHSGPLRT